MSVQPLVTSKIIIKKEMHDVSYESKDVKIPIKESNNAKLTSIYEEPHTNTTGNIDVSELATSIAAKMMADQVKIPKRKVVEVDIKREIAIGNVDKTAVKSQTYKGPVNNKVAQLRALRNK